MGKYKAFDAIAFHIGSEKRCLSTNSICVYKYIYTTASHLLNADILTEAIGGNWQ